MKRLRHFLTVTDVSDSQLRQLLQEAAKAKRQRRYRPLALSGKVVALVFQKPSMRTRVAFEVAVLQLGGSVIYLGQDDIQLGQREPIKDVARVLSRYVDAIVARTFSHEDVETFAAHSRVPVINGLSDLWHPCQALADLLTLQEYFGRLRGLRVAYVGDGNNVLHSLLDGCAMLGVHVSVATPPRYRPDARIWAAASRRAKPHGARLAWCADPRQAVRGADVLYTDVWVSMGQERQRATRLKLFRPYQVNQALLRLAKPGCRVMHCLPAHRGEEITQDVLEGPRSLVIDQAENRLHAQKALLAFLLGWRLEAGGSRQ
ncbi:MAG: ornithine carbamoyltransferase [Candidatus Omnitrophica bacterium]|nr:ornithine carbamoyltransferase [Candidatus Omnitrophota bacterium]